MHHVRPVCVRVVDACRCGADKLHSPGCDSASRFASAYPLVAPASALRAAYAEPPASGVSAPSATLGAETEAEVGATNRGDIFDDEEEGVEMVVVGFGGEENGTADEVPAVPEEPRGSDNNSHQASRGRKRKASEPESVKQRLAKRLAKGRAGVELLTVDHV